jgi:hypothetical protein
MFFLVMSNFPNPHNSANVSPPCGSVKANQNFCQAQDCTRLVKKMLLLYNNFAMMGLELQI